LRDPELIEAAQVPYLPPSAPPKPSIAAPPVFDAKAMVDATKRKVDNPVYGHMPAMTAENKAAVEAARAKMKRKRRRDRIVGRIMAVIVIAVLAGVGYALLRMYQHDQKDQGSEPARVTTDEAPGDAVNLGPLGEQAEVIDAQDATNSEATASAGGLVGAIDDAEQAVGQTNANAGQSNPLPLEEVLPAEIVELATEMDPVDGFSRYLVDLNHASLREPISTPGWIFYLRDLPQAPSLSAGLTVLPEVAPGQLAIAVETSGDQVTRLVAYAPSDGIRIDL
jgi:hypothetical protein